MKIVFYSTSAEDHFRYRLPVARRLRDAGYTVVFVGPNGGYATRTAEHGFAYRYLPAGAGETGTLYDMVVAVRLARIYRQERPDIVHHFTLHGLVRGGIAARLARVDWVVHSVPPLIQRVRESRTLRSGAAPMLRFVLRRAAVTFHSLEDRHAFLEKGLLRPERTHIVACTGIEVADYPFQEEPDRAPVVTMIGPLRSTSAIESFAVAAQRLHDRGFPARFALISTRERSPAVSRSTLNSWVEEGIVEWWGPRHGRADVLSKIHVACVIDHEGSEVPHLLLEAAASARPTVAVDSPVSRVLIRPGETGHLVAPDDADALSEAIEDILKDGERRRCMGRSIRRVIESEISADHVAKQTMATYEQLFDRGRAI